MSYCQNNTVMKQIIRIPTRVNTLTHWGRVTHICVSKLTNIGSDDGLSHGRRQAIIWTNAGILLIRTLGTYFSEIRGKILSFSFKKMHLKMSSAKWRPFSFGLSELITTMDATRMGCPGVSLKYFLFCDVRHIFVSPFSHNRSADTWIFCWYVFRKDVDWEYGAFQHLNNSPFETIDQ